MIKFVSKFKYACMLIAVFLVATVACYFIEGLNLDISFQGGTQIQVQVADESSDDDALAAAIQSATGKVTNVQKSKSFDINSSEDRYFLVIKLASNQALNAEERAKVQELVREQANVVEIENQDPFEFQNVEPSIGQEMLWAGIKGLVIAFVLMILYIAFRFRKIAGLQAGLSTILALLVDVVIVFGVYVIFHIAFNESFIAAILTIIGYSINDKIIVFDRIRELTISGRRKLAHEEIVDLSINETLPRTINTTITTLIALVVVLVMSLIYNVGSIVEFAIPLIIGVTCGTLTSMFVATPVYAKWMDSRTAKR